MLASILQQKGMECTLFERDQDRSTRDQGGIVDLHREMGQLALSEAGLIEDFRKHSLPAVEAMKLMKSDGRVMWDENDSSNAGIDHSRDRPEIDRSKLRDMLLDSIPPGFIKWNKKLIRVVPTEGSNAKYNLHFADGVEAGFDLVVGTDGAWSKVRSLLTNQTPFYSGITVIELKATQVSKNKKWLSDFTGQGSLFMFDEGRALVCQRNGNDSIRVYAAVRQPETWIDDCGINWEQRDLAQKTFTERYFGDCHDDIKRVIALEASDGLIPRRLWMLPVGMKWSPSQPGVTLLGDAAHLMTPFAGVGVNVALADALDLSRALLKRKDAMEAAADEDLQPHLAECLREYEGKMFERAEENMVKTWKGLQHHFSAEGVEERVGRLQARAKMREAAKLRQEA